MPINPRKKNAIDAVISIIAGFSIFDLIIYLLNSEKVVSRKLINPFTICIKHTVKDLSTLFQEGFISFWIRLWNWLCETTSKTRGRDSFFEGVEGEVDLLEAGLNINLLQIFHFFGKRLLCDQIRKNQRKR